MANSQGRRAGLGRGVSLGLGLAATLLSVRGAQATLSFGDLSLSGDLSAQNLVRMRSASDYAFIQQRNTFRFRADYDWVKDGMLIGKYNISSLGVDKSHLYILYRGVYDSIYDWAPSQPMTDVYGKKLTEGPTSFASLPDSTRDSLKFENSLREAYIDVDFREIPLSLRLGKQQIVWGETDNFRMLDRINALDLTWHLEQEIDLGRGWDQLRIPYWMMKWLYRLPDTGPFSNQFFEGYYNPGDWYPNKRTFLPYSPWSIPFQSPFEVGQGALLFPNGVAEGRLFRQGTYDRNPADNSQVGARWSGVAGGVQMTLNYFYQRWGGDDGTNSAQTDAISGLTAAQLATDYVAKGLAPVEAIFPYVHTVGVSANYFEGNFTDAILKMETIMDFGVPFTDGDKRPIPGIPIIFGATKRNMWKGMIGFDRPTWVRFLNKNSTILFLGQFFWHRLLNNEEYIPGVQTGFVGAYGPLDAPVRNPSDPNAPALTCDTNGECKAVDRVRTWEALVTLAATTFYMGGSLVPQLTYILDPVNKFNMEVAWSIDYFLTPDFIVNVAQKYFINTTEDPVYETWGVGGANRGRSETQLRLTYQF